ncbi:MAG: glycosyltransferase, partial [Stellaceae bacterium]
MDETTLVDRPTDDSRPADEHEIARLVTLGAGEASATLAGSTAILVLGMHRSGTSALTGMLHHLGVGLGARLMPATSDNPRGYWEHAEIVAVHQSLMAGYGFAWDDLRPLPAALLGDGSATKRLEAVLQRDFVDAPLWGVKDPRLCRLLPLWLPMLSRLGVTPRFVLALRHPIEVAASLRARDGINVQCAALLWLRHVLEAERATRGGTRTIVHYEALVGAAGWRSAAARMAAELDQSWPTAAVSAAGIDAFLAPELRHNRAGGADSRTASGLGGWLGTVYEAFCAADPALPNICDRVQGELDHAGELFLPIVGEMVGGLAEQRAQRQIQDRTAVDLTERLARAEHEAAELRHRAVRAEGEAKALKQGHGPVTVDGARLIPPPAVEDAYPQWIAARAATAAARPDWVAERIVQWPFVPSLALGMVVPEGNEAVVALTLRSLLGQIAGTWTVQVVAKGDMPAPLAVFPQLVWHRCDDEAPADRLNRLLGECGADFVALIDAGDQLAPHALFAVADALFRHPEWGALYSDEDRIDLQGAQSTPHFKPDFNLDLMRSMPYVGGLLALRRELFVEVGGFDPRWDGAEEYDMALRLAERVGAPGFGHVADVLYHRLASSGRSRRSVEAICADLPKIVQGHLDRSRVAAEAESGSPPHTCRVRYHHDGPEPLVSIVIPTKNQLHLLKRCVETVLQVTTYQSYEIIVVDNGSDAADACDYLAMIESKSAEIGSRIRVLRHPGVFNYSAMNNHAVREAVHGEYLCLLNNDTAPLDGEWLSEMVSLARRPEIGAVGSKLFYPDGHIQHGGVLLGVGWGGAADHPYNHEPGAAPGYWGRLQTVQGFSAVTAACLVTRRSLWEEVGGLDEAELAVSFNDVDYCLRLRAAGHLVVWTPFARLLHEASVSLRSDVEGKALADKNARFARESLAMFRRWMPQIAFDPAYNRNLSSLGLGFSVETTSAPTWDPEFRPRERVLVYAADREGCGEYRTIAPSRALFKSGVLHTYETMRLLTAPELARLAPDSVVFQRQLEWSQIAIIEMVKNTSRTFRVFEIDDLITNLPRQSPHRANIPPDVGDRLKKALSLCDRLVVSTEPLAREYGKWCAETVVLPNRLEKSRWLGLVPKRRQGSKPRVGWAGAIGHRGDLELMRNVVEATRREVDWVFFGMCPDALRPLIAEYHDWVLLHDYAKTLASLDLDLAVAPLAPHPFNECKSNLRLLEYGILGYPVLCTDILPYQGDLPVFRVPNRPREWIAKILELVADRAALEAAGTRLRQA